MQLTQDVTWRTHPRISLKDSRGKSKPRKQTKLPGEKCLKEPPIHLIAFIFFLCHAQNNFISNVKREDEKYHHVYGQLWKHVESPLEELEVVEDAINNLTNSSNSVCWTTLYGRLDWEIHSNESQHFTLSTCAASKKYRYCVCTIKNNQTQKKRGDVSHFSFVSALSFKLDLFHSSSIASQLFDVFHSIFSRVDGAGESRENRKSFVLLFVIKWIYYEIFHRANLERIETWWRDDSLAFFPVVFDHRFRGQVKCRVWIQKHTIDDEEMKRELDIQWK